MYYVYSHMKNGNIFYIGCGNEARPHNINQRSDLWKKIYKVFGDFKVKIHGCFDNDYDAYNLEMKLINEYSPIANKRLPKKVPDSAIKSKAFTNYYLQNNFDWVLDEIDSVGFARINGYGRPPMILMNQSDLENILMNEGLSATLLADLTF